MFLSLGSTLEGIVRPFIIGGILYGIYLVFRIQIRRGVTPFRNPFQPGWRQLHDQYGSMANVHTTDLIFGWIGGLHCELKIIFTAQEVLIRNMTSSSVAVQIPYTDIQVIQAPTTWQLTRLSEKEHTPGKFQAGGVAVELPAYWAYQLLKHIDAAGNKA